MTTGFQCRRCGTVYGVQIRHGKSRISTLALTICRAGACPSTWRTILWFLFGQRFPSWRGRGPFA